MSIIRLHHLPNLITLSRIALVPVLILLLKDQDYGLALAVFVIAGVTDALDGWLAKRLNVQSHFGAVLDPAADKLLLVTAYVMLTILGYIPFWLTLAVVSRDVLIVGGYLLYTSHAGPVRMRPSILSKLNTLLQIALVCFLLIKLAAGLEWPHVVTIMIYAVLISTVASGAHYLWSWMVLKEIEPASTRDRP
jgi:cardiolipin synthase